MRIRVKIARRARAPDRDVFVTVSARDLCGVYGGAFDQDRYRKEIAECEAVPTK